MKETVFVSDSPESTFEFGKKLASDLRPGDLVLLAGGLGAGKTLLIKGLMDALGYDADDVTSPSFALVNLYKTNDLDVYHLDLWRIDKGNAAEVVGLDEILDEPRAITLIEWPERLDRAFSNRTIHVSLAGDGELPRRISVRIPEDSDKKI